MMNKVKQKLTLDRSVTYQIKVPGHLDSSWSEWDGRMTISVVNGEHNPPLTILTGTIDQAGLLGLLRRLYVFGVPLISVECVECN